jgi:hypothetical protein
MGDPTTGKGAIHWIAFGALAAGLALVIGTLVPGIIPARASGVKL